MKRVPMSARAQAKENLGKWFQEVTDISMIYGLTKTQFSSKDYATVTISAWDEIDLGHLPEETRPAMAAMRRSAEALGEKP